MKLITKLRRPAVKYVAGETLIKSRAGIWHLLGPDGRAPRFYWFHGLEKAVEGKKYFSSDEVKARNMRWVTIRGAKVLLQGAPDGSFVVVGGAGGKLNHLKVDKILSKEEYAKRHKERLQAMTQSEKIKDVPGDGEGEETVEVDRRRRINDEESKAKRAKLRRVKEWRNEMHREYIDRIMDVVGAKDINEFLGEQKVKEIVERVRESFEDKFKDKEPTDKGDKEKSGKKKEFDIEKMKASILKRTEELKIIEAKRIAKAIEVEARNKIARDFFGEFEGAVNKGLDETLTEGSTEIKDAFEIIKITKKLKTGVKQAKKLVEDRKNLKVGTVFAGDSDIDEQAILSEIEQNIETANNVRLYDEVNAHAKTMGHHINNGAARAFNGMMGSIYGAGSYFNEDLIESLGIEAVSRMVAEKLEREGKTEKVLSALKEYSDKIRATTVTKAMESAARSRKDADMIMQGSVGDVPLYTEAQGRALAIRHLAMAYTELGGAVGSLRAMAHVINALEDPPNTKLSVDLGPNEDRAKRKLERAGIDVSKSRLIRGSDKHWHLDVDTDKIIPFLEKTQAQMDEDSRITAIKKHKANDGSQAPGMKSKWGYNPAKKAFEKSIADAQEAGYRFAKEKDKCLLDFSAGIGKTYVAANLVTDAIQNGAKRILVVVPANLKEQTSDEGLKKFCPDGVASQVKWANEKMSPEARRAMYAEDGVHVISHNALENDAEALQALGYDMIIVDEAHQLVNSKEGSTQVKEAPKGVEGSKSYQSLKKMADKSKRVVAMTGTPIKTDKSEAYKIAALLGQEKALGSMSEFAKRHKNIGQATGAFTGAEVDAFRKELSPFSYSQGYTLDVKKISNNVQVKSSPAQRAAYKQIMEKYGTDTEAKKRGASGERDIELWRASNLAGGRDNSKYKAMVEHFKSLPEGEKGLVFFSQGAAKEGSSQYAKHLNEDFGPGFAVHINSEIPRKTISLYKRALAGRMTEAEQAKHPDLKNLRVLVATDTLATGHNLQSAGVIYKVDPPQSKAQDDQQNARSYRNGQTRDVNIVYLEGDDPNEINKRYNFRKKGKEADLMGNPDSVSVSDDRGFGSYLRATEKEDMGVKDELRESAA